MFGIIGGFLFLLPQRNIPQLLGCLWLARESPWRSGLLSSLSFDKAGL